MKKIFLIGCLLQSIVSFAQEIEFKGVIMDSFNTPIPYVNIGILHKSIGTVSNDLGEFSLKLHESMKSDTIRISCLGFESKKIIVENIFKNTSKDNHLILNSFIEKLSEIQLKPNKTKEYSKGKIKQHTNSVVNFSAYKEIQRNLGTEIGKKFKLGSKKVSFLKSFQFLLKENNFEYLKFRVHIYSIKNNLPNKLLFNEAIFVKVSDKFQNKNLVEVDLSPFNIQVKQDIIMTVEWVENSDNGNILSLPLTIPSIGSNHYYKFGSQNSWKRYSTISTSMKLDYEQ